MPLEERRIEAGTVVVGMFVCRLDRPWTETPFPLQGFLVESQADIDRLRALCQHVWIDVEKSVDRGPRGLLLRLGFRRERPGGGLLPEPAPYPDPVPLADEVARAGPAWDDARRFAARCIDDIRAGRRVQVDDLAKTLEPVVSSVVRNPDAYFWLDALRRRDGYAYTHAINCCALAATFGRQLGFPRELLVDLAAGGMLMDIGMAAMPDGQFDHPRRLEGSERAAVQRHVALGLERLEAAGLSNPALLEMIGSHHERLDGSGYPQRLAGLGIPLSGRMLGIVDSFDAMCSDRPHQAAMSRHHALQGLYRHRDQLYQAELLEQFSQALGVYPTGSLVELSTGEVAVVMAQNIARRLFPRVTLLTRPDKSIDPAFRQVDLWADRDDAAGSRRSIVRALPAGAYGLELSEYFL
jgi:HD-GYP domain-containing protein (c-di-GMP phosphodiesterase class II)